MPFELFIALCAVAVLVGALAALYKTSGSDTSVQYPYGKLTALSDTEVQHADGTIARRINGSWHWPDGSLTRWTFPFENAVRERKARIEMGVEQP
jgi:hypothetical protein